MGLSPATSAMADLWKLTQFMFELTNERDERPDDSSSGERRREDRVGEEKKHIYIY